MNEVTQKDHLVMMTDTVLTMVKTQQTPKDEAQVPEGDPPRLGRRSHSKS